MRTEQASVTTGHLAWRVCTAILSHSGKGSFCYKAIKPRLPKDAQRSWYQKMPILLASPSATHNVINGAHTLCMALVQSHHQTS